MSDHYPMPLARADRIAAKIVEWLRPACERIEIAGSIRRRKPEVHDIEIVCVPKIEVAALDLFGEATDARNILDACVEQALAKGHVSRRADKNGKTALGARYKRLDVDNGISDGWRPLDLFSVLPPAQWGVIMAIRTGPAEFSRRLVTRKSEGGLLPEHMWVRDGLIWATNAGPGARPRTILPAGGVVHTPEERDVFEALGIPWIEPEERR